MAETNGRTTDEAFITLATNDIYSRGALVLAESLKKHGTTRHLVVMITPHVSPSAREALEEVFDVVRVVDVLDSRDAAHLALLERPELGITFTKIHCWTFTEYKKCVFMDADMMALQNIDELFQREELSAAADTGWPDIFNSGLFVFVPSLETFNRLLLLAQSEGSFDGGDQGLLNTYFSGWGTEDISRHLPFLYNLTVSASYSYLPAFRKFGKDAKVVHFIGSVKPWHHVYNRVTGGVHQVAGPHDTSMKHFPQYLSEWWAIYNERVQKFFSKEQEMRSHICVEPQEETEQNPEGYCHENVENVNQYEEPECELKDTPEPQTPEVPETPYNWEPPISFFRKPPSYVTLDFTPPRAPPEVKISQPTHDIIVTQPITPPPTKTASNHEERRSPPSTSVKSNSKKVVSSIVTPRYKRRKAKTPVLFDDPNFKLRPYPFYFVPISRSITEELATPNERPSKIGETRSRVPKMMAEETSLRDIMLIPSAIIQSQKSDEDGATAAPNGEEISRKEKDQHMRDWEQGNIDYMGRDSFANIQAALDLFL